MAIYSEMHFSVWNVFQYGLQCIRYVFKKQKIHLHIFFFHMFVSGQATPIISVLFQVIKGLSPKTALNILFSAGQFPNAHQATSCYCLFLADVPSSPYINPTPPPRYKPTARLRTYIQDS